MVKISGTGAVAAALLLTLQATAQTSAGAPSAPLAGCVQKNGGIYTLVDENSKTKVQLHGGNLRAGQHIQVTGTAAANASPAGGATQVLEVLVARLRFSRCPASSVPPAVAQAQAADPITARHTYSPSALWEALSYWNTT